MKLNSKMIKKCYISSSISFLHVFSFAFLIEKKDLKKVLELEALGFPLDEAASRETLYFRFIFARQYFRVFCLDGEVIGYICGTLSSEDSLTEECMSNHRADGNHLGIHSVVIEEEHRRKGFATLMIRRYLDLILEENNLLSIRLLCKQHLIEFYSLNNFRLRGESNVEHGKDTWYEMSIQGTRKEE